MTPSIEELEIMVLRLDGIDVSKDNGDDNSGVVIGVESVDEVFSDSNLETSVLDVGKMSTVTVDFKESAED